MVYESIIAAIKEELQAVRQRAAAAEGAARAAEERVRESMYYSRDKFAAMDEQVKGLTQVGRAQLVRARPWQMWLPGVPAEQAGMVAQQGDG